jgi:predicted nuclease of predicted toxin-antitoxin system
VTPRAVEHLQAAGHDAVHASAIQLSKASDSVLIEAARRDGRIVITADLDYPRLLALNKADRPGVILFRGGSYSDDQMLALLDRVLKQCAARVTGWAARSRAHGRRRPRSFYADRRHLARRAQADSISRALARRRAISHTIATTTIAMSGTAT